MNLAVLASRDSWYVNDLTRAAKQRSHHLSRIDFRQLTGYVAGGATHIRGGTIDLDEFDAVIVRTMPAGSLEQIVHRMDILQRLEASGTIVLNSPRSLECAVDKFLTTSRLAAADQP